MKRRRILDAARDLARPVAKRVLYRSVQPGSRTEWVYRSLYRANFVARELYDWGVRSLWATPLFLSRCDFYGQRIAVDRLPYIEGAVHIELGSDIRFSGLVGIKSPNRGDPVLRIGDGVFLGHHTTFIVASRVEIGNYVSIGGGSYIADTEGHASYNPNRPIWEVYASEEDVAPVVIEDNVQLGRGCVVLKGVTIGARAVVGAYSVVRNDIPPDAVVAGNPARVIKRMTPTPAAAAGP
jgi:acetyltransferase-like isoleucine patch superfamily enzyme